MLGLLLRRRGVDAFEGQNDGRRREVRRYSAVVAVAQQVVTHRTPLPS
jgi:hypothetical protein